MAPSDPRRSGNPARRAAASRTPAPTGARRLVSSRSRDVLMRLTRLPPLVIPSVMLLLMLVGLSAPLALALPALGVVVVFVLWLALLSWPVLDAKGRLLRGVMVGIVAGAAIARVAGWL